MAKQKRARGPHGRFVAQIKEEGTGQLGEATRQGHVLVDLITPGWGSSGYYSEELLQRDMPKIYPAGTHMYVDHPTEAEEWERPERSVTELAAVTTEDARWDDSRQASVAEAILFPDHAEALKAKAQAIGVSIRAHGFREDGEVDGTEGPIITELTEGLSVDFVTKAGRGGQIGELLESARKEEKVEPQLLVETLVAAAGEDPESDVKDFIQRVAESQGQPDPFESGDPEKEEAMADKDIEERLRELEKSSAEQGEQIESLTEERDEANARADRAEDRAVRIEAEAIVSEALADDSEDDDGNPVIVELPERAFARAKDAALRGEVPVTEDGKVDKDKLAERARKAAKDEHDYLHPEGKGTSPVREVGGGRSQENGEGNEEGELAEAFGRIGLSEDTAQVAAKGR